MTRNDFTSWNYKGPYYYSSNKKSKEQNNAKLKIFCTKRKLQHLIAHLKSFDQNTTNTKEDACTGRTVKEITDYFENITKNNPRIRLESQKTYAQNWDTSFDYKKRNSIPSLPKTSFPYTHLKKTKTSSNQRELNLHSIWKEKILQTKSVHYKSEVLEAKNVLSSIRESVRSSFVCGMLMLHYIL